MKALADSVIFAEYNDDHRFSLRARTCPEGLNLELELRDFSRGCNDVKNIVMTDREFDRLAKSLGYKKSEK